MLTRKDWDLLNSALSIGQTLAISRIQERQHMGLDHAIYTGWLEALNASKKLLETKLGALVPFEEWYAA
jgi:hypothetical protein